MPVRLSIEDLHALATLRGGTCLSTSYRGRSAKYRWCCAKGHVWETASANIKAGHWCRVCAGKPPGSLQQMHALAAARRGKCLSPRYTTNRTPLRWECAEGHQWQANPYAIRAGGWCPHCGGMARHTIQRMQEAAARRGGRCLSAVYVSIFEKLLWRCGRGHQWEASGDRVRRGHWCPECAGGREGVRNDTALPSAVARRQERSC